MADVAHEPRISAENNPWYLLATLHGEPSSVDDELAIKNRVTWNRWIAAKIPDDVKASLLEAARYSADELTPLPEEERRDIQSKIGNDVPNETDFSDLEFKKPFFAAGFFFPENTNFSGATFSEEANFDMATFHKSATFVRSTFSGHASFSSVTFSQAADFSRANFWQIANFVRATFSEFAGFVSATFGEDARFVSVTFSGPTRFESATFHQEAVFGGATFSDDANFERTTFYEYAGFRSATFSGFAAGFRSATFFRVADFERATFWGRPILRTPVSALWLLSLEPKCKMRHLSTQHNSLRHQDFSPPIYMKARHGTM